MNYKVNLKKLVDIAIIPTHAHNGDAGYDLYSVEEHELKPFERKAVKTGISVEIPTFVYGRVAPRSGLAVKNGIDVMAGVVDSTYRGEICVVLINLGSDNVKINIGDKIAQIIFEYHIDVDFCIVNELDITERGENGFGSSDKSKDVEFKHPEIHPTHNAEEPKSSYGVIIDKYNKVGGIPVRKKYADEVKERNRS